MKQLLSILIVLSITSVASAQMMDPAYGLATAAKEEAENNHHALITTYNWLNDTVVPSCYDELSLAIINGLPVVDAITYEERITNTAIELDETHVSYLVVYASQKTVRADGMYAEGDYANAWRQYELVIDIPQQQYNDVQGGCGTTLVNIEQELWMWNNL